MSIAEKLVKIAENEHKVYNAGYVQGVEDNRGINPEWTDWRYFSLDNNRNSLISKLKYNDTSNGKDFSYMARGCDAIEIFPEIDTGNGENFCGMFYANHSLKEPPNLNTSKGKDFSYMYNCCCNMVSFPEHDLSNGENLSYMYWNCQMATNSISNGTTTTSPLHLYLPVAKNLKGMFRNSYRIDKVSFSSLDASILENTEELFNSCSSTALGLDYGLSQVMDAVTGKTGGAMMFRGCDKLERVSLEINPYIPDDATNVWKETFEWCYALTRLQITGENRWSGLNLKYSKNLNKSSIVKVIETLSESVSGKYITLSKVAVNNAFETSSGAADGSTSTEWTTLIAPKQTAGWTISLS